MSKIMDVFIEINDANTNDILVWADEESIDKIKSIDGVASAYSHIYPTRYEVTIDPRYDKYEVMREIRRLFIGEKEND